MFKKLTAVMTALVVALCVLSIEVFAAGSCSIVQKSYASKGEEFTVDIVLSENPGIKSLSCNIKYNYSEIEFVSVSDGGLLSGFHSFNNQIMQTLALEWYGNGSNTDANGIVATVTFRALTDSANGSILSNAVTATDANNVRQLIDGMTTVILFGSQNDIPEPQAPDVQTGPDETENLEEEDTEVIPEDTVPTETEPEVTTTTKATTKRTTKATTTEKVTTTEPTTTEPPVTTTDPTTSLPPETTPPTTPTLPPTEPTTPPTEPVSESAAAPQTSAEAGFADTYAEVDNSSAGMGTLLLAIIMIILTGVVVYGIERRRHSRR